ncbi:MAG: hypothetical protein PVH03_03380, partial [Chloroflexota bacterium]
MSEREENFQDVLDALSTLEPAATDAPRPASHSLARLRLAMEQEDRRIGFWRFTAMFNRKYALVPILVVLLLVVAFTFPGVRAAASDFLGLFRVQKFAAISISPEQMALLEEVAESGLYPGEIEMVDEPGEPQLVDSLESAEAMAGWLARNPERLAEPDSVYYTDGGHGRLTVNVENARTLISAAGVDPALIPDSLDGATVDVTVYPSISQNWNEGVALMQSPSPLIEYPEDVDTVALGEAFLQVLGMESGQARRLAQQIDWTNTVLLPIPENVATFNEIRVDGVPGLGLTSLDGQNSAILWQKNDTVYVLSGAEIENLVDL